MEPRNINSDCPCEAIETGVFPALKVLEGRADGSSVWGGKFRNYQITVRLLEVNLKEPKLIN